MGLAGKTIARVEEAPSEGYGTYRMWFTDGTCVDLEPCGYEADDIRFTELTAEDLERKRVEAEQEAYRRAVERERAARRREERRAAHQAALTPKQYEKWLADQQQTAANFSRAMKETFLPAIKADMSRPGLIGS